MVVVAAAAAVVVAVVAVAVDKQRSQQQVVVVVGPVRTIVMLVTAVHCRHRGRRCCKMGSESALIRDV